MKEENQKILNELYGKIPSAQYAAIFEFILRGEYKMTMHKYGKIIELGYHRDIGYDDAPVDMRYFCYEFREDGKRRLSSTNAPFDYSREMEWH